MPSHDLTPTPGLEVDGYRLVRFLGRGGFGEVWLCRSGATVSHHAIKFISGANPELLEKEHHSLTLYRGTAGRLRSPHLVSIEHINRHGNTLYYVMPLADGITASDPADPSWQPLSLAALIAAHTSAPDWFSSKEIISLILPILDALQTLSDAGLVHRDVKPENILFFGGSPCLGDISLLGEDAAVITRRGTPGYATPTWYQGGHPDMYAVAATLYTLLTGNPPDRMGKSSFLGHPKAKHRSRSPSGRNGSGSMPWSVAPPRKRSASATLISAPWRRPYHLRESRHHYRCLIPRRLPSRSNQLQPRLRECCGCWRYWRSL